MDEQVHDPRYNGRMVAAFLTFCGEADCDHFSLLYSAPEGPEMTRTDAEEELRAAGWTQAADGSWRCPDHAAIP